MTQKNLLKSLTSSCKKIKEEDLYDLVVYGSIVKGKSYPKDIDIMGIFLEGSLKYRLEIMQKIKSKLEISYSIPLDVKSMLLTDFFKPEFLARQGVILEGKSLIDGKNIASKFGFKGYKLFTYNLAGLNNSEKTRYIYALSGRYGKGVLERAKGTSLGKGVIIVPIENSLEFEEFLESWKISYKSQNILIG